MFFNNPTTFRIAIFIIAIVCVYDIHLTVFFSESLNNLEQNPVCVYIIKNFGVHTFVLIKSFCMFLCCAICLLISGTKYRIAVYGLAVFQIFLFLYLTFSTGSNVKSLSIDEENTNPLIHLIEWHTNASGK